MKNLINLLERVADEKGVNYLTNLLERRGFNYDVVYDQFIFPQIIDSEYIEELTKILEECLEELPF